MADDQALDQRLAEMRSRRVEALRTQARREAALDILDTDGAVSSDAVDTRVAATFTAPSDAALDNLMAQEAAAQVVHTADQVEIAKAIVDKSDANVENFRLLLAAAQEGAANARAQLDGLTAAHGDAEVMAEHAGGKGDAAEAPSPTAVDAPADVASAAAVASGGQT